MRYIFPDLEEGPRETRAFQHNSSRSARVASSTISGLTGRIHEYRAANRVRASRRHRLGHAVLQAPLRIIAIVAAAGHVRVVNPAGSASLWFEQHQVEDGWAFVGDDRCSIAMLSTWFMTRSQDTIAHGWPADARGPHAPIGHLCDDFVTMARDC
jgi:hypothetical protein